ncbi:hypothetical protein IWQ61_000770 [Dispira simplex]|nr:hypothetical protein IWQ61_000770 [Dispira simplex]
MSTSSLISTYSNDRLPFALGDTVTDSRTRASYVLERLIGSGSYAVVYLARNHLSGKRYALKCLCKESLSSEQIAMQHNEIQLHTQVSKFHNVVALHRSFETRDWIFLVLEYVDGQDLYEWITSEPMNHVRPALDSHVNQAKRFAIYKSIFQQALDAVADVHRCGVYHRDIKPENFIVTRDHRIKLTDFGLATREARSDEFECGSRPYMSRENRSTRRTYYLSAKSDVWALGIIFLNLFYGVTPWSQPDCDISKSFAAFHQDGVGFLMNRVGCPFEVARFLTRRVFCHEMVRCSVTDMQEWCSTLSNVYQMDASEFALPATQPITYRPSFDLEVDEEEVDRLVPEESYATSNAVAIPVVRQSSATTYGQSNHVNQLLIPSMAVPAPVSSFSWDDTIDEMNPNDGFPFSMESTTSTLVSFPITNRVNDFTGGSHSAVVPNSSHLPLPATQPSPFSCSWADDDDDQEFSKELDNVLLGTTTPSATNLTTKHAMSSVVASSSVTSSSSGMISALRSSLASKLNALSVSRNSACSAHSGVFLMDGF